MKFAFKLPRSKITWIIIALIALVLGYLVYKGVFIYKEGAASKDKCSVTSCSNAKDNCVNALVNEKGKWYQCTGNKKQCTKSSTVSNPKDLKRCKQY